MDLFQTADDRSARNRQDTLAAKAELARLNTALASIGKPAIQVPEVAAGLPALQFALITRALLQCYDALAAAGVALTNSV